MTRRVFVLGTICMEGVKATTPTVRTQGTAATPTANVDTKRDTDKLADSIITYAKVHPKYLVKTLLLRELQSWIVDSIVAGIKEKGWLHVSTIVVVWLLRWTNDPNY